MSERDRGFERVSNELLLSAEAVDVFFSLSTAGLAARRPPLLAETYALERRLRPVESSESFGKSLESERKLRNISFMLISSLAEHSRTFTLKRENVIRLSLLQRARFLKSNHECQVI
ncbi:hypothetical protein Trydic_g8889 [Trypoxylus dichotomus]